MVDWAEAGPEPDAENLRAHLADRGLESVVGELLDSNTAYLNRAAGLDDARTQLTHLLGMQRRAVELPAELAAAERAFADEESEETLEQLTEAVRRNHDLARAEAEIPD